jgi:leader peptidase (prepilin peptidase)/N-methyltransferase
LWAGLWLKFVVGVDIEPLPAHLATFLAYALFVSVLIPIFLIDLERFEIPDELNAALLIIGLLFAGLVPNAPTAWISLEFVDKFREALNSIEQVFPIDLWVAKQAVSSGAVNIGDALIGAESSVLFLALITLGGRLLFRQNAMGHGDIKLARGIGALLMMPGAFASFMIAVFIGVFTGIPFAIWRYCKVAKVEASVEEIKGKRKKVKNKHKKAKTELPQPEEPLESVFSILLNTLVYLLWLDVLVLFLPKNVQFKLDVALAWVTGYFPPGVNFKEALAEATNLPEEEEAFEPGVTHIPFGPSLVCGALVVIYFGEIVIGWYMAYLTLFTPR